MWIGPVAWATEEGSHLELVEHELVRMCVASCQPMMIRLKPVAVKSRCRTSQAFANAHPFTGRLSRR